MNEENAIKSEEKFKSDVTDNIIEFHRDTKEHIGLRKFSKISKNYNEENLRKRKKNRVLTLNESRRKLALRADVMNKNFFRALRREIKRIFENYLISNGLSTSKCKRTFKTNLKRFCEYLLMEIVGDNEECKGKTLFYKNKCQ